VTLLTLKAVFHLPLRATEGFSASILQLAQISLPIPDYSTLSRCGCTLEVRIPRARSGDLVLEEVDEPLEQISGDGAYDTQGCYGAIEQRGARAIIPPRENAVVNCGVEWTARNATLERIAEIGRTAGKVETGSHRRSLSETAFSRLKRLFGERLSSRTEEGRTREGRIWCRALNRMTQLGLPDSYVVVAG
jgi:hypothetical protein